MLFVFVVGVVVADTAVDSGDPGARVVLRVGNMRRVENLCVWEGLMGDPYMYVGFVWLKG